jgi:hypothetical protein
MTKMFWAACYFSVLVLTLSACSGGGGGSTAVPAPPVVPLGPSYPSISRSVYDLSVPTAKAGQEVVLTINIRDQFSNAFNPGSKWSMTVNVLCGATCSDPSVSSEAGSSPTQRLFRFTPQSTAAHTIQVSFEPTNSYFSQFNKDFPTGVPSSEVAGTALTFPQYNVCDLPAKESLHGLKGEEVVAGKTSMAICSDSDLAMVAADVFFLDKNLYLASDIDMSPYYAKGKPEFAIADACDSNGVCREFSGTFYGNRKTISNYKRTAGLGLFGNLMGGLVMELNLLNTTQTGGSIGGALATRMGQDAKLEKVTLSGSVSGTDQVGGVVGDVIQSHLYSVQSSVSVSSNKVAGGLIGGTKKDSSVGNVVQSASTGNVTVNNVPTGFTGVAGGLIGTVLDSTAVYQSYYNGTINSSGYAGGIAGKFGGVMSEVYVNASITGSLGSGGFYHTSVVPASGDPANNIGKSFVNVSLTGNQTGVIGVNCNSTTASALFANGSVQECAFVSAYTATTPVKRADVQTISALMAQVQEIVTQWQSVWLFPASSLPLLK